MIIPVVQEKLSSREQEIFDLLLKGSSPKEIAFKLNIGYSTVDYHRSNLYSKLGIHSIQELLATYGKDGAVNAAGPEAAPVEDRVRKRRRFRVLLFAGIAFLGVLMFCAGYFFAKPSSTIQFDSKPFAVTLGNNEPHGWHTHFVPSAIRNTRITAGEIYTFKYSFSSDVDFGYVMVFFIDITLHDADGLGTHAFLSSTRRIVSNVKANTEYSGEVTLIINQSASSEDPSANLLEISVLPFEPDHKPPTLAFTRFEISKTH